MPQEISALGPSSISDIPYDSFPKATWTPTRPSSTAVALPTYTGDPDSSFPNGQYLSRFSRVSSSESGLTNQDIDLYNRCNLPSRPLPYNPAPYNQTAPSSDRNSKGQNRSDEKMKMKRSWVSISIEKPDYQAEEAPCKRQGAINANCHFQNTNGKFSGLQPYTSDFGDQQHCYCEKYPFFEAVMGCQKCFDMHGGIEGYHYFPDSYINAVADAYCNASPINKSFLDFVHDWRTTAKEAQVPSTTAKDILGAQTAASLYYTAPAAAIGQKAKAASAATSKKRWTVGSMVIGLLVGGSLVLI